MISIFLVGCEKKSAPETGPVENGAKVKTTDDGKITIQLPPSPKGYVIHSIECSQTELNVSYKDTSDIKSRVLKLKYYTKKNETEIYTVELH